MHIMQIITPSFKDIEGDMKFTSPNLMSIGRGVGGLVLGGLMAFNLVEPATALAATAGLAASDAEGSLIRATRPFPRLQKAIRAIPSSWGRIMDPIADKAYMGGVFLGGALNGSIPLEHAVGVGGTETAAMGATLVATSRRGGQVPEVGRIGRMGMIERMQMVVGDLGAAATHGPVHEALHVFGEVGFIGSVALGASSFVNIWRQGGQPAPGPEA
jgi:hypothetical protein